MMELIFATHNPHKTEEAKAILGNGFFIKNLKDIGFMYDIPETADTLEGNALLKVHYIFEKFHCDCFADDTGLEVEALNNRPGVYSARYAGENSTYQENVIKILDEMKGVSNRKACFRTVIALILNGKEYLFEGRVNGFIITEPRGNAGFGYDPVFRPENTDLTFAELGEHIKNQISHRGIVMRKLMEFLCNS